jgi:hypothetical protein
MMGRMVMEAAGPLVLGSFSPAAKSDPQPSRGVPGSAENGGRSNLTVEYIDPTFGSDWDDFVHRHPDSNCFHGSAWAKVLIKTYGHQPFYLRFSSRNETVALLPIMEVASPLTGRRGVSLPFSDHCQPLMFPGANASCLQTPIRNLARERRWQHLELRSEDNLTSGVPSSSKFYGHTLDLRPGLEEIFSGFHSSVRRAIRKAESSGLTLHIEQTQAALRDFQSLHARTRRRHGVPPQPPAFFRRIHEEIIERDKGFIVLARRGSIALAAALFFIWKEKALYKFGASEQSSQSLRANNLVMWEAIRHLAGRGIQELDFGRTAVDHAGLRRFKLGWGTQEKRISYSRLDVAAGEWRPARSTTSAFLSHLFSRMPLVVNQLAGRLLYPHLD